MWVLESIGSGYMGCVGNPRLVSEVRMWLALRSKIAVWAPCRGTGHRKGGSRIMVFEVRVKLEVKLGV